jgi:hypothetical protein
VYYLNKFRGVHNHPLDYNLMDPDNTTELLKKKVVGRIVLYHENEMSFGNYVQGGRESVLLDNKGKMNSDCYEFK